MRPKWLHQPDSHGVYLFTSILRNWDMPQLARVSRHDYGNAVVVYKVKFWHNILVEVDCADVKGFWYGPLYDKQDTDPKVCNVDN